MATQSPNTTTTTTTIPTIPTPAAAPAITVLASTRALISSVLTSATIVIALDTGRISSVFHSVLPPSAFPPGTPYKDFSPHVLLPGLVDAHVHLNEPGRTEWEGFFTGTQAAAFGGVTTVVDMPLNAIPPTTTVAGLKEKIAAAEGKCWVDVGFYGGLVPGNEGELKDLVKEGVRGFKGFLIDSGVDEFPAVTAPDIRKAMLELSDSPTTLMFHAEMVPPITASVGDEVQTSDAPAVPEGPLTAYSTFLASRPASFETTAIDEILTLAPLAPNLPLHIVHLSAMEAIPALRAARRRGVNITAETCFHYLSLAAEEIADGDTRHKCCPPIRGQGNQEKLWEELHRYAQTDGVIKTVVSDHSPCTPDLKLLPAHIPGSCSESGAKQEEVGGDNDGNFFTAWGGISSVGLGLPILWTELSRRNQNKNDSSTTTAATSALEDIVQWCCINTAKQVGLETRKGDLSVGFDGDVCVFDDVAEWVVEPSTMLFRNKCSPYQGRRLKGLVRETWVRGHKVFSRQDGFGDMKPEGVLLLEPRTR
ncbi:allantoinase [Polytolypa hystricis UAMH7299]|uniref:allantoinase n=1 Tax=Polytolypa hystricis (strain UAMH7299) TaxID=1447883 RepID=A0A2B7YDK8_POLH7|nr:allantoinase [Polytolypa hystricis UAMH7299]